MKRSYRILFILQSFGTGGSERLVLDIARLLDRERFLPVVGSLGGGTMEKEFRHRGIQTVVFDKKPGIDFSLVGKIAGYLRHHAIDLVNVHHFSPLFYLFLSAMLYPRVRTVHTEHSSVDFVPKEDRWRWIFDWMMRNVDINVGVSVGATEMFRRVKKLPEKNVVFIPNGVDFSRFDRCLETISLEEFEIPEHARVVGLFANFRPEKNHRILLTAFRTVAGELSDAYLLLAGEGDLQGEMKEICLELEIADRVRFLGPRFDVPRLMKIVDVYCLPSRIEGLPLSLLEAMGSGVCVLATDVPGNNDIVRDGINGVLVAPGDPDALASGLVNLLQNEEYRKRLAIEGRKTARLRYSAETMVNDYEHLFLRILNEGRDDSSPSIQ